MDDCYIKPRHAWNAMVTARAHDYIATLLYVLRVGNVVIYHLILATIFQDMKAGGVGTHGSYPGHTFPAVDVTVPLSTITPARAIASYRFLLVPVLQLITLPQL